MPDVVFAEKFKWSPNGIKIVTYEPGKAAVSDECAASAKAAGVLKGPAKKKKPAAAAAKPAAATAGKEPAPASSEKPAATDNKALAGAAENKGS